MISLTTIINNPNMRDFDKAAKNDAKKIKGTLVRINDEMEIARTKIKNGSVFLDEYVGLLSENGIDLNIYCSNIFYMRDEKELYYKLMFKRIR